MALLAYKFIQAQLPVIAQELDDIHGKVLPSIIQGLVGMQAQVHCLQLINLQGGELILHQLSVLELGLLVDHLANYLDGLDRAPLQLFLKEDLRWLLACERTQPLEVVFATDGSSHQQQLYT